MKILTFFLLLIGGCVNNKTKQVSEPLTPVSESTAPVVKTVPFDPQYLGSFTSLKSKLITTFIEYKELKEQDIKEVKFVDSIKIKDFGDAKIYKIMLSDDLPEVYSKENYLIVNKKSKIGAIFLLDTLFYIRKTKNDTSYLLGGVEKIKTKGFFKIYDFKKSNEFEEVLNTLDYCENGIPVFNNGLECISYLPEMMEFKNADINNDGLLDVNFSGKIAYYCKGLETGYGREDREPISLKKSSFSFILKIDQNMKLRYEILNQNTVCNILKN